MHRFFFLDLASISIFLEIWAYLGIQYVRCIVSYAFMNGLVWMELNETTLCCMKSTFWKKVQLWDLLFLVHISLCNITYRSLLNSSLLPFYCGEYFMYLSQFLMKEVFSFRRNHRWTKTTRPIACFHGFKHLNVYQQQESFLFQCLQRF